MGARVRRLEVVRVVGAGDRHPERPGDAEGPVGHPDLVVEPVRLDLHEVVVAPEDVGVPAGDLERLALLPGQEEPRDLGVEAPGQDQEAVRVLGQELLVDPRLVVEPLEVALRDELDQVPVARLVPDQGGDVVRALVLPVDRGALEPAARGDVELAAEDGLDAGGPRVLVEVDRAEQVAVVGERDGREAELRRPARPGASGAPRRRGGCTPSGRGGGRSRRPRSRCLVTGLSVSPGAAGERGPRRSPRTPGNAARAPPAAPANRASQLGASPGPASRATPGRNCVTSGSATSRSGCPTRGRGRGQEEGVDGGEHAGRRELQPERLRVADHVPEQHQHADRRHDEREERSRAPAGRPG